jgi:hypothetical protein
MARSPLYATTFDGEVPPRILKSSEGGYGVEHPRTLPQVFKHAADTWGERNALAVKRGKAVSRYSI